MKENNLHKHNSRKKLNMENVQKTDPLHSFMAVTACAVVSVVLAVGSKVLVKDSDSRVYAAADALNESETTRTAEYFLPTGIAGVVSGVQKTPTAGSLVNRIGTSCERVMVGQRVQTIKREAAEFDVSSSMESKVNDFDSKALSMAQSATMMSDEDYDTLLRIVEAEAGGEDIKGRILVANVIMNRVKSPEFPDTVTEVVYENTNGVAQFSPTYDGRIYEVTVSEDTRKAVKEALEGTDYSQGALFFVEKATAEKQNVSWFDKDLKRLFKYGVHDFYTYPDESAGQPPAKEDGSKEGKTQSISEDGIVQMVKNE